MKQAIIDHLKGILFGNYTIDNLVESAEEHLERICEINIKSLENVCSYQFTSGEMAMNTLKGLPAYLKALLIAYCEKIDRERFIIHARQEVQVDELALPWDRVQSRIGDELEMMFGLRSYKQFSIIRSNLEKKKNLSRYNRRMKHYMGIEIADVNGLYVIRCLDQGLLFSFLSDLLNLLDPVKGGENVEQKSTEKMNGTFGMD